MNYKINFDNYNSNFSLPSIIVASNLKEIDGDYLKVILQIFIHPDTEYSVSLLSDLLGLTIDKVDESIKYWIDKNVLIAYNSVKPTINIVSEQNNKPKFTPKLDVEIGFLINRMEEVLQRTINSNDIKSIVYMYETYRIPVDVMLMLIQYCVDMGKKDIKYIERVGLEWYNEGITTYALAEEYLKVKMEKRQSSYKIKKLFGIERALSAKEQEFIDRWVNEFNFDMEIIELAYERMIKNIDKISFPYINKIFQNWKEKGYNTVEDVNNNEPNGFSGFGGFNKNNGKTSYDINELVDYWNKNIP